MYRPSVLRFSAGAYSARFTALRHPDDEAIGGLRYLKNIHIPIFKRDFLVPTLSFVSLFVFPLIIIAIAVVPSLTSLFNDAVKYLAAKWTVINPITENFWYMVIVILLVSTLISLAITYAVSLGGGYLSSAVSKNLNGLTWKQIRKLGFGNDAIGEVSISADSTCPWMRSEWLPLPAQLTKEISELSNKAAAASVGKFRSLLTQLSEKNQEAHAFLFSEYLTWDELIHCSYFNVPRFRMLVAYAIANSEGFRPTQAFMNHPDYNLLAGWYEEIKPKTAQS
jgi:hypothetical protein